MNATTTVHIVDDPDETLTHASIGPRFTDAHREAESREDWTELTRLEREQRKMADAYGQAWLAAVERVAERDGIEVDAIVTRDAAERDDHLRRNGTRDRSDGPDRIDEVWQSAHDEVHADCDEDGTWTVR